MSITQANNTTIVVCDGEAVKELFFKLSTQSVRIRFILRWNIEVTFEEVRAHLGFETQRQWSDKAIARTTPLLMGLFSMVCLFRIEMLKNCSLPVLSTAWYKKESKETFSDILVFVRRAIWSARYFNDSTNTPDYYKIKPELVESLLDHLSGTT